MNDYIGKTLKDEKDEEYLILKVINYKGISCAYAMKVLDKSKVLEYGSFCVFEIG